jgi:hypothetical protein
LNFRPGTNNIIRAEGANHLSDRQGWRRSNDFTSVGGYGMIPKCLLRALTWMLFFG